MIKGTIINPVRGAWNSVTLPATNLTGGTKYWIVILSPYRAGTVRYRDISSGGKSQLSSQNNLTTLPSVWSLGRNSTNSPLSAYGVQD